MQIEIKNYEYFAAIDNQVREIFSKFEETVMNKKLFDIYKINNIKEDEIIEYPIEGYYYKSIRLKKYFQMIRNLQQNDKIYTNIKESEEVEELKQFLSDTIWGTIKSDTTNSPFPKMKDILTISMEKCGKWTIEDITKEINNNITNNPNLVELAALTKDIKCLVAGAETNCLYREMAFKCCYMKEEYIWLVDKEVEDLGTKLVERYNEIMSNFKYTAKIKIPTIQNISLLNIKLENPRVACLGMDELGRYYHWILDGDTVIEKWHNKIITTENYGKEPDKFLNIKGK